MAPILDGFGKPDGRRDAAMSEYGKQFANVELDVLDDVGEDEVTQLARRAAGKTAAAETAAETAQPEETSDAAVEDESEETHQLRRPPAQPAAALSLDLDGQAGWKPSPPASPSASASASASGSHGAGPVPTLASRQSPAPVRRGLFSGDRITNMLACAAVGLLLTIFPAKQLARSYEVREVEPLLDELDGAIDHPLGVQAGLVAEPEKIAAQIHEGREKVRRRYLAIWLLVGLPIGLGLSFAPRPGD